jgi:predicted metalloprotease with PDZ domain
MKVIYSMVATMTVLAACAAAGSRAAPRAFMPGGAIPMPRDRPYPGELQIRVDATDVARRIVHVHETITGLGAAAVLYLPKWLPGEHAPTGPIDRLAAIRMQAQGQRVGWIRDPLDVHAFHVQSTHSSGALEVDFDYLPPVSAQIGDAELGNDVLVIDWIKLLLYPAGYYVRQIPVRASLVLPAGWHAASALEAFATHGASIEYQRVNVEQLADSPVMAGRQFQSLDLDPGAKVPVHLQVFSDRLESLEVKPEQLAFFRALVQQAYRLFGARHYAHYDFLLAPSEQLGFGIGVEHEQSTELQLDPDWFSKWEDTGARKDDPAHEFVHSWNGKFRRPVDLWTPNFNVPMQNTLLWLYEGQTQYWGIVLTARSGIWTQSQVLDRLASEAAGEETEAGRQWRALQDTTHDEIINPRRPQSWPDWQRFEDYYSEGMLIWLEADALIRQRSGDQRSLDDFARAFFGIGDGNAGTVTYSFADIVSALNRIEPYDWAGFLRQRLDTAAKPTLLDGLRAAGYQLVYTDVPGAFLEKRDGQYKRDSFHYSLGLSIDREDGSIRYVKWGSPAFKSSLIPGTKIVAVNGMAYKAEELKRAVTVAQTGRDAIELIVREGDRYRTVRLDYHDGLRYPHLKRDGQPRARLDDILKAR